ncbi:MAG: nucleotide sugar dehydrogenase, partial [Candidatus Micrarchaeota archaeon]
RKIVLNNVRAVAKEIGKHLRKKNRYTLVVVKSTVTPMTCETIVIPLLEKHSGKKAGVEFGLCSNPEFLRENKAFEDFMNPDRIVLGEFDKRSGDMLESIYKGFSCPIVRTDLRTSEMAKYANNTFYATKISFFNELHLICEKFGADSTLIRKIVQMDRFYATHPWEHSHCFGGACLPKDLDALIHFAKSNKFHDPVLLKAVRTINEEIALAGNETKIPATIQAPAYIPMWLKGSPVNGSNGARAER